MYNLDQALKGQICALQWLLTVTVSWEIQGNHVEISGKVLFLKTKIPQF